MSKMPTLIICSKPAEIAVGHFITMSIKAILLYSYQEYGQHTDVFIQVKFNYGMIEYKFYVNKVKFDNTPGRKLKTTIAHSSQLMGHNLTYEDYAMKKRLVIATALCAAFYAGMKVEHFLTVDACLDAGGAMQNDIFCER